MHGVSWRLLVCWVSCWGRGDTVENGAPESGADRVHPDRCPSSACDGTVLTAHVQRNTCNMPPAPPCRQRDEPLGSKLRRAMELAVQGEGEAFRAGVAVERCELCGSTGAQAGQMLELIHELHRGEQTGAPAVPADLPPARLLLCSACRPTAPM